MFPLIFARFCTMEFFFEQHADALLQLVIYGCLVFNDLSACASQKELHSKKKIIS